MNKNEEFSEKKFNSFLYLINQGNLDKVKQFFNKKQNLFINHLHYDNELIFRYSCFHIEIAKWIWDLSIKINSPINIHAKNDEAFINSCFRCDLNMLKWLWKTSKDINSIIDIKKKYDLLGSDNAFSACFWNGKIEVIEWIWKLSKEINSPFDIHSNDEYAFITACSRGNSDAAKWLWNLSKETNSPININIKKDNVFIKCCLYGKIEIIKWLWDLSIDINSPIDIHAYLNQNNDINNIKDPFTIICERGHLEVAKWIWDKAKNINSPINLQNKEFIWRGKYPKYIKTALLLTKLYKEENKKNNDIKKTKPEHELINEEINGKIIKKIKLSFKDLSNDHTKTNIGLVENNDYVDI